MIAAIAVVIATRSREKWETGGQQMAGGRQEISEQSEWSFCSSPRTSDFSYCPQSLLSHRQLAHRVPVNFDMDEEKVQENVPEKVEEKADCEAYCEEEEDADRAAAAHLSLHPDPSSDRQSECDDFDPDTVVSEAAFWHVSSPACALLFMTQTHSHTDHADRSQSQERLCNRHESRTGA